MAVSAEVRRNATLVLVAGGVYFTLQALLTGFAVPLHPYERALFEGLATEDLWVLRLTMMLVSTAGLVLAFRAWVRPAGKAAWAGAAFVAVSWAPVHYGPQARPEILLMLACVGAAGFATRWLVERDRGALVGTGVAVTAAMVCDPFAGVVLAVALAAVVLVWARVQGGPALVALGVAVLVGRGLAWVARVVLANGASVARAAATEASGGARLQVLGVLEPVGAGGSDARAAAGAAAILALIALGLVWQRWPHRHNAARVGVAVALVLLAAMLAGGNARAPALLPVLGTVAVAVGSGLLAAWRTSRETGAVLATISYVVVVGAFVGWQGWIAATAA